VPVSELCASSVPKTSGMSCPCGAPRIGWTGEAKVELIGPGWHACPGAFLGLDHLPRQLRPAVVAA
jgi:hypothetical protein